MKMTSLATRVVLLAVLACSSHADDATIVRAREASGALGKHLKGRLSAAMEQGAINQALTVCHEEAPRIANEVSRESGLSVKRVAEKTRNPSNHPDPWETSALATLERQLLEGVPPTQLETHAWLEQEDGTREFRMLKGIVTEPMCLACHGPVVSTEILQSIRGLYPEDSATGFLPGSLRGAFSVRITE